MKVAILKDYANLSLQTAEFIIDLINEKPDSILSIASGSSPIGIYQHLVKAVREGRVDFSQATFVCLDELVGMGRDDKGSASYSLFKEFYDPAGIQLEQIHLFDSKSGNLEEECNKINTLISECGGLDLVLLGVGLNGHLGFNEPGVSFEKYAHVTELDNITIEGLKKYFLQQTFDLTKGITLGIKHIIESKTAIVVANGSSKKDIIQQMIHGPVTNQCPCTILQHHQNAYAFVDEAAYLKERD